MNTNTQNTRKVTEWDPKLDDALAHWSDVVARLSYTELEQAFICDFRPSIESFSSLDDARFDYANFLMVQSTFFNGLEADRA